MHELLNGNKPAVAGIQLRVEKIEDNKRLRNMSVRIIIEFIDKENKPLFVIDNGCALGAGDVLTIMDIHNAMSFKMTSG